MNKKYYFNNEFKDAKENDIVYFDMPSFCSGEYCAKVYKDEYGLYILKKNYPKYNDFRLNEPFWDKDWQKEIID
jgi:hypothetical protein